MGDQNPFREIYALIWKAGESDDTFNAKDFEDRIPRLMAWLKELHSNGKLAACGGG